MYELSNGASFLVQQMTAASPGTSVFDGSDYGRASLALFGGGPSAGKLWFRAKRYGVASNGISVALINPGGTFTATTATLNGAVVEVRLRTVSGTIQATAKEVADTVNAVRGNAFPVVADYDRTTLGGTVVTAVSSTPLTGGVDPRIEARNSHFKWDIPQNVNSGFFYFEQDVPILIRQMGASFPTAGSVVTFKVWIVNLTPGLAPYSTEKVPLFEAQVSSTLTDVGFSDNRSPLLPYQGLLVTCPLPGLVNFQLRIDNRFPYP